jgi:hypothetical protein
MEPPVNQILVRCLVGLHYDRPGLLRRSQRGQSTVEYALVLLGAAAVALMVVAWASRTDVIGRLFDTVVGRILTQAE